MVLIGCFPIQKVGRVFVGRIMDTPRLGNQKRTVHIDTTTPTGTAISYSQGRDRQKPSIIWSRR
jgi:hypothetical protein